VEGEQAEGDVCPACTATGGGSVTLAYLESLVSEVWEFFIRRCVPSSYYFPSERADEARRTGSRLATRVLHTTLKTATQTTTKPKTPPMRKLPQTQTPNRKAHASSSPPALAPSLSATLRPSAFRPFLRMKKGTRGSGLSWGIRAMLFLPHHLLCLHLRLLNTLSPTM
jgi:hypothetical protein